MPSIQIRNLSEEAYTTLKVRAKVDRRSLQQEAAWVLETALSFRGGVHQPDWRQVDTIRKQMRQRYGVLPDSTPLIRRMRDER